MRWRDLRRSKNVEDRRGQGRRGFGFPFPGRGRGMRLPIPKTRAGRGGGMSIFGLLFILLIMWLLGVNPLEVLQGGFPGGPGQSTQVNLPKIDLPKLDAPSTSTQREARPPFEFPGFPGQKPRPNTQAAGQEDEMKAFVSTVLGTTEEIWSDIFSRAGKTYREPKLVLFTGAVRSQCGLGQSQMGPFYCPLDQKVYIDLAFYKELRNRFRAPGDFAQAYVIAHEVGHHVQTLLGIAEKVQRSKTRMNKKSANRLQVMMELQADCLSGIWASRLKHGVLEQGDIEEGLNAASAIGDDRIQKQTQGYVVPDAFTHGSSKQRMRWFNRGYQSGKFSACDTFNAPSL